MKNSRHTKKYTKETEKKKNVCLPNNSSFDERYELHRNELNGIIIS